MVFVASLVFTILTTLSIPTFPSGTAAPPTSTVGFVQYSSSERGFSVRYPSDWTVENDPETFYCYAPDYEASFSVSKPVPIHGKTLDEVVTEWRSMYENLSPEATFTGEREVQAGGVRGHEWTVVWENTTTGMRITMRMAIFVANDTLYTLSFLTGTEHYNNYASTFDAILNSFSPTAAAPAPATTTAPGGGVTKAGIPLRIDTRWVIQTAWKIVSPDGTVTYSVTPVKLMAYGGSPGVTGYTWGKPTGGRFPPAGIIIDPLTGVLQGTGGPLAEPGVYYFDVEVTDGTSTATATLAIQIREYRKQSDLDPGPPIVEFQQAFLDNIQLPNAKAGQPYGATLWVEGGKPPYWWSLRPGYADFALAGLWLDESRGLIRGTISESMVGRTIRFAVTVTDSTGKEAMCGGPHTEQGPIYEIYVEP
jgi:hypothetical protein